MKILVVAMGLMCAVGLSADAWATDCRILTTPPPYIQGELNDLLCDPDGKLKVIPTLVTPLGDTLIDETNNALKITNTTIMAGERQPASATNSYLATRQESNLSVISKVTAVTIGGGVANDSHLMGIQILTALTGTCAVTGFADSDGTAQTWTLPIASVGFKDFFGAINSAGALTITCSNIADDNLVLALWRLR